MNNNKINSLNLFRGIAGYGVAISHFYYFIFDSTFFQFLSIFFVEFFFVLSGFVLYPQIIKIYKNSRNIKIFCIRRWMRTLPLFILALTVYSVYFTKFDLDTLKYLFFISYIKENLLDLDYFTISWSLAVEEYFYIVFPIFLLLLRKVKILEIIISFIVIIYFLKVINLIFFNTNMEFYRISTFLRLDAIAIGLFIRATLDKLLSNKINLLFFILSVVISYIIYFEISNISKIRSFFLVLLIQLSSINAILLFINCNKYFNSKLIAKIFTLLSAQTYSVYLFHYIVIILLKENLYYISSSLLLVFYLIILFILSSITYFFFEIEIMKKRPEYF